MRILFDVCHPAQLNFYLRAIRELSADHQVLLTYLRRGKLPGIVEREAGSLANVKTLGVGSHKGTKWSILVGANLLRIPRMVWVTLTFRPHIEFSNGYTAGVGPRLLGIPACHFQDDPERGRLFLFLMKLFSDRIYIPFYPAKGKIRPVNALKEWAYLSPRHFTPNEQIPARLGLENKRYVFVREVITSTFNYQGQRSNIIESIASGFPRGLRVVLSLEDKRRREFFPDDWLVLEEPVEDIHSLIYYARAVVSSGDSIAREGAQLGVPSIYCGVRRMHANQVLIREGVLFHSGAAETGARLAELVADRRFEEQERFREQLAAKWDDITRLIVAEAKRSGAT